MKNKRCENGSKIKNLREMEIGPHQDVIGIHVAAHERISYLELKVIEKTPNFSELLEKHDFTMSVIGLGGDMDALQLVADMCGRKAKDVKPGDLAVVFRRLPLVEEQESSLLKPRDIADKFEAAVSVFIAERDKVKVPKSVPVAA